MLKEFIGIKFAKDKNELFIWFSVENYLHSQLTASAQVYV